MTSSSKILASLAITLLLGAEQSAAGEYSLYFLGGEVIRPFALAMILGVLVGTYSSIYIAAPVLLLLERRFGGGAAAEVAAKERTVRSGPRVDAKGKRKGAGKAGKGKAGKGKAA